MHKLKDCWKLKTQKYTDFFQGWPNYFSKIGKALINKKLKLQ